MMRCATSLLILILAVTGRVIAQDGVAAPASDARDQGNYILRAGDVVHVQIYQEAELDRELPVSKDGTIALPLIGPVKFAGRTVREVELEIFRRYDADYLVNPQINVSVVKYAERWINVLGMVNNPGTVAFPPEEKLSLLDAITRAGGFTRLGDRRRVRLTRTDADGRVQQYEVDADKIMKGSSESQWILEPGDSVYVPERRS